MIAEIIQDKMDDTKQARVMLVDDHPLLTSSLANLMEERGWSIVAEHVDASNFFNSFRDLKPNLIITDIVMPGPDIIQLISESRQLGQVYKLVILSAYFSESNLARAIDIGAEGIVSKNDGLFEFFEGVEQVIAGGTFVSSSLRERFYVDLRDTVRPKPKFSMLTGREVEILRMIAKGLSIKAIAVELRLSAKTVDRHRTNIMNKLDVHTQVDLVRFAFSERLIIG